MDSSFSVLLRLDDVGTTMPFHVMKEESTSSLQRTRLRSPLNSISLGGLKEFSAARCIAEITGGVGRLTRRSAKETPAPGTRCFSLSRRSGPLLAETLHLLARSVSRIISECRRLVVRARAVPGTKAARSAHMFFLHPASPQSFMPGNVIASGKTVWAEPGAQGFLSRVLGTSSSWVPARPRGRTGPPAA